MAEIIPDQPMTDSHPAPQLHHCFQVLEDDIVCRQQVSTNSELTGLRIWVQQQKRSLLMATLPEDAIDTEKTLDQEQLSSHPLIIELIEERDALFPSSLQSHAKQLLPIILLLNENLSPKQTIHLKSQGLLAIGSVLLSGAMPLVIQRCLGMAASPQVNQYIRSRFSPELLLSNPSSDQPASLKLLDLRQEMALHKGVISTKKHSPFSFSLITGQAGSGKSEVLARRAALVLKTAPKSRILVLSHNKSISNALKHAISNLSKNADRIQCLPFHEWCRKLLGGTWRFVYEDQEIELFDLMIKRHFEHEPLSRTGLMREINFIKDRQITSEADYLSTIKSSNSLALATPIRKRIWQAMVDIDTHLKDRKSSLWGDAARKLGEALDDGKTVEAYTHVLVDEAQYFAPAWLRLITRLIATQGDLCLATDPAQGFKNRHLDLSSIGIDAESNTTRLPNHYRCSQGISKVADNFRQHRLMESIQPALYSINELEPISPEQQPQLLHFPTKEDQQNRLFSEIHQLIQRGYEANDILILNADIQSSRLLAQDMRDTLRIRATTLTGSMIFEDNTIKLSDIESATGLQSKVVFITGLETIFDAENSEELSDREKHSLQTDNTNLLHMAMTRASERLYLLISTKTVPASLNIEGLATPTLSQDYLAPVRYLNP